MIMSTLHHTHEIIELTEDYNLESEVSGDIGKKRLGKSLKKHSFEDDINKFFEAIEIGSYRHIKDASHKRAMKRPMRVSPSHASGIGISEPVSLKQALRGLCISQASEMAAVKKRMSRPSASPGVLELGAVKKLQRDVVIEAGEGQQPLNEVKGSFMEISFVSEGSSSNISHKALESGNVSVPETSRIKGQSSVLSENVPPITDEGCRENLELTFASTLDKKHVDKLRSASSSSHNVKNERIRSPSRGCEQSLKTQNIAKKKIVAKRIFTTKNHSQHSEGETSKIVYKTPDPIMEKECEELEKPSPSSSTNAASSNSLYSSASKHFHAPHIFHKPKIDVMKGDERSREKGEFSQSSKSSIGEYSSTTSYSDESYLSTSNRSGYRPHMSKDLRWEAISSVQKHHGRLGMTHFKLVRKIGGGDIGSVYLAELIGTSCLFAVKVIDNEYLISRKKMQRAQTEKEILEILDHPFLPTLFAHFTTNKYSCLVMEYCPGGDLHVLRQKQLRKSFPEKAARFYAAEILLALEYLHMLGVVYRDLKPENILVREDGHIMLSDFDLSLRCNANSTLLKSSSPVTETPKKMSSPCSDTTCIHPFCLQPSWQLSCFTPRFLTAVRTRRVKSEVAAQPQLVVEPTTARSNSFVGTHEYIAPEIIKGEGHGSAVDWWTFGVFFYELLYGTTPFKGSTNDETISNVVSKCLKFPPHPTVSSHARDLMRRLLKKEPDDRLGSAKGAAEIKQHPFFEGLNWALIRCETPPELPNLFDGVSQSKESKHPSELMEFEMF